MYLILFFAPIFLAHIYVFQRVALAPGWPLAATMLIACIEIVGFVLVVTLGPGHAKHPTREGVPFKLQHYWLGFMFLLSILCGVSDLSQVAMALVLPAPWTDWIEVSRLRATSLVGLGAILAGYAAMQGRRHPALKKVDIGLERWPASLDGFRIVQISDLHIGSSVGQEFAELVSSRLEQLAPDLVAVTGDLVDGSVAEIGSLLEPFAKVRAPHGVWFVVGNHDFYSDIDPWLERIAELGWRTLRNERVRIGVPGADFDLAGIDDSHGAPPGGGPRLDLALAGRDSSRPVVLLSHAPRTFEASVEAGIDLQLSGHTHGGQIWPAHMSILLREGWLAGLYRMGRSQLYVSSGTGAWGPPMRLGSRSEITEFRLRRA